MKNDEKRMILPLICIVVAFIIYIFLDYINVTNFLRVNISNINMDLFSLILNALVVVILYVITYYSLDIKQIKKETNAKETAVLLIKNSYKTCLNYINFLNKEETLTKYIVPKVNFNDLNLNNQIVQSLQNQPFDTLNSIVQLAINGSVDKNILEKYLEVIDEYKLLVTLKIAFSDINKIENNKQIKKIIEDKELQLVTQLKKEV